MESVALIDCTFAVSVTGTPPLFCTYALARVALPPRCKREIPLCDACRGDREGDDVLFFPFPPSPFLTPRTTRGEENSGATLLPPRFSFVRASGPRGTHGHAFLFSFHLVTIRYNYASSYVRTYRQWVSRGDELKSFRGERNETRIPRANRSR